MTQMLALSSEERKEKAGKVVELAQHTGVLPKPAKAVSLQRVPLQKRGTGEVIQASYNKLTDTYTHAGEEIDITEYTKPVSGKSKKLYGPSGELLYEETDGISATPAVKTEAQKKILQSTEAMAQIKSIEDLYKPEYLEWTTQAGQLWGKIKEKAGVGLSKDEKVFKTKYTKFKRNTFNFLNQYLKNQSGVAISPKEAERLKQSMPIMGDSPTEFLAKLGEVKTDLERTRLIYGMALKEYGVEKGTPGVNKRADQFASNPNADVMGEYILSINPQWGNLPVEQQEENVVDELERLGFING